MFFYKMQKNDYKKIIFSDFKKIQGTTPKVDFALYSCSCSPLKNEVFNHLQAESL